VKLEHFEYSAKVNLFQKFNLKGETNILNRLITCKVRYLKPLFVIVLMTMAHENPKSKLKYCENVFNKFFEFHLYTVLYSVNKLVFLSEHSHIVLAYILPKDCSLLLHH